jgi:chromosome segregation ATPase
MATSIIKNRCVICGKEKASLKCEGCSQTFCNKHFNDHRQELSKELDETEITRDLLQQKLNEQTVDPQKHPLIQQINQWEQDSIRKIQQTAREAKELIIKHTTRHRTKIETKLTKLTDQLRESREENDFIETDLNQWREELKRLEEEFINPSNILIQQSSIPLVTKIAVQIFGKDFISIL